MIYDIVIVGGGVIGTAILNKLTRLNQKCLLLEKGSDVAVGASKANSGIVHAGFDCKPGTLKARLNVRGAEIMPKLCKELSVPLINNSALVIGNDMSKVEELKERGLKNGVSGLEVLDRSKLIELLPNISDNITCGLLAKTSSIVSPYLLTIALAEESVLNGATIVFNYDTKSVKKENGLYIFSDGNQEFIAKKVIIACGGAHNEFAKIIGSKQYDIKYRRGEYYLLDVNSLDLNGYTIFPLPTKDSKGVLVSPTTHGNIIVGPTSILTDDNTPITTAMGLEDIASKCGEMINNIDLRKNIRVFAGVRTLVGDDFVIEKDPDDNNIISVTGICSPGLTASPAIAEYVSELLSISGEEKEMIKREPQIRIKDLSTDELNKLIQKNKSYGKIVCRCELVSEAEIVNAINSPLKPVSIDAIKRRTRAGMGRCQGGFCFSKVMEIIAREKNIPLDEVIKENSKSRIIVGNIK